MSRIAAALNLNCQLMSAAPPAHQSAGARNAPHEDASTDPAILADADSWTVHTIRVRYHWELPNIVRAQLRLAHDLHEDLVTLQLAYADDVRAIWSSYPEVAAALNPNCTAPKKRPQRQANRFEGRKSPAAQQESRR